ncbi:MAG: DnaJ domain-containing protein [Thermodesulfovibrionales bacterium]|nr:DnaJ domain-containing protein [Thermodesulfovibrionales bacterium]
MGDKEKRNFRRQRVDMDFDLMLGAKKFRAKVVDYSPLGIGVLIEDHPPVLKDTILDLSVESLFVNGNGRVIWLNQTDSGVRAGIEGAEAIRGLLRNYSLPDILIGLQRSGRTGILAIKAGDVLKKIYVNGGDIIFASSSLEEDRLGEYLLEIGKINKKQYDDSVVMLKKTGKRQGAILVELGYLRPQELPAAVKGQVERIILTLFGLKDSGFEFREGPLPTEEVITLRLSAASLIERGLKAITDEGYIRSLVSPLSGSVLCFSTYPLDLFQDIRHDEANKAVLSAIDDKKTVEDILSSLGLREFEATKAIYALLSTRIIDVKEEAGAASGVSFEEVLSEPSITVAQEVIDRINDMHDRYRELGYYGVLGVKEHSPAEEIRKAFYKTAKEFHPDRHFYLPEDMKDKLHEIFSYTTNAYTTLTNPAARKDYDRARSLKAVQKSNKEMAEERFFEGLAELKKGSIKEAEKLFAEAAYYDGSQAKYHHHYGEILRRLGKLKEAEKTLRRALDKEPLNADCLAEAGLVYLGLGLPLRAEASFKKAVGIDPSNKKALDGLAETV